MEEKNNHLSNSERFLSAFNTVTRELEKLVQGRGHLPFYRLVDMGKKKNGLIMTYQNDLKELSELRNAIIHHADYPEYVIAEPHLSVVDKIEKLAGELTKPKTLIPYFSRKVQTYQKDDSLKSVLLTIKHSGYSQFPIYENNHFVGLITDRGIAKWFANHINDDQVSLKFDTTLNEVLSFEKNRRNYVFMSQDQTIYDVREKFHQHYDQFAIRLDAVLITENGYPNERLLGIVTPFDIAQLPFMKI
ncbi:CBS domain-containing protein [Bacillus sp. Marseille-P3661]|uniref:CBS domain-containing protein n=1 Tax=Bacillus sp. Marseille-P3661 TaxID=1936234 RepID=UPI000C85EE2D|nr:CBS domain-containing protein [Bacillus sp. Marseille-P3661]